MRIAHFGTFDVENYGDLLFPVVARHFLAPVAKHFDFVSPHGGPALYPDAETTRGILDIDWASFDFDIALIGGGNIVACRPTTLPAYTRRPGLGLVAYSALWSSACIRAAQCGAAVAWNAPGVMHREWSESQRHVLRGCVSYSDYVSFREADYIPDLMSDRSIAIVPDTAIALSHVWPLATLRPEQKKNEKKWRLAGGYFVFHAKKRNFETVESKRKAAGVVSQFAKKTGMKPVLLAIGRCHGDHELLAEFSRNIKVDHALVDMPQSLREVTALLANASYIFSASLHGAIVAASYGVPVNLLEIPLPKYKAFFEGHLGVKGVIVESFEALTPKTYAASIRRAQNIHGAADRACLLVREHFKKILLLEDKHKDRSEAVAGLKKHMTDAMKSKPISRVLPLETLF